MGGDLRGSSASSGGRGRKILFSLCSISAAEAPNWQVTTEAYSYNFKYDCPQSAVVWLPALMFSASWLEQNLTLVSLWDTENGREVVPALQTLHDHIVTMTPPQKEGRQSGLEWPSRPQSADLEVVVIRQDIGKVVGTPNH